MKANAPNKAWNRRWESYIRPCSFLVLFFFTLKQDPRPHQRLYREPLRSNVPRGGLKPEIAKFEVGPPQGESTPKGHLIFGDERNTPRGV